MAAKNCIRSVCWFAATAAFLSVAAAAQTDAALSLYGAFNGATNGNGTEQSPSNSAGGLFELRHISNPILGFDLTYSFNRANQKYSSTVSCGIPCGNISPATISADAHEITADWVASFHAANLLPFGLVGVGALLNEPAGGQSNTSSATKPVFVYGAGLDWGLLPHLGLRFQYRGNLYEAPDLSTVFRSTSAFTHNSEPMIGVYFRL